MEKHGAKGGKGINGAKLAHHIRKVSKAKEHLDNASRDHNDYVREIYAKNSEGGSVEGTPANIPIVRNSTF